MKPENSLERIYRIMTDRLIHYKHLHCDHLANHFHKLPIINLPLKKRLPLPNRYEMDLIILESLNDWILIFMSLFWLSFQIVEALSGFIHRTVKYHFLCDLLHELVINTLAVWSNIKLQYYTPPWIVFRHRMKKKMKLSILYYLFTFYNIEVRKKELTLEKMSLHCEGIRLITKVSTSE